MSSTPITKLHTPKGAVYDVIKADYAGDSGRLLLFKYPLSDREFIPVWFKKTDFPGKTPNDFAVPNSMEFVLTDVVNVGSDIQTATMTMQQSITMAYYARWWRPEMFNRMTVANALAVGIDTDATIDENLTLDGNYSYKLLQIDASSQDVTVTLPTYYSPQGEVKILPVNNSANAVKVRAANGEYLNGVLEDGAGSSDMTLPVCDHPLVFRQQADGSNLGWVNQIVVSGDASDTNPVCNIRRLTQTQYDAITTPDDNTLYIITD